MDLSAEDRRRIYEAQEQLKKIEQESKRRKIARGCLGCLGALVLAGVLFGLWANRQAARREAEFARPGRHDVEAQFKAHNAIRAQLRAPATAKFSEERVVYQDNGVHGVIGMVDAQNLFGAMVRQKWICVVQHRGGNNWTVKEPCALVD